MNSNVPLWVTILIGLGGVVGGPLGVWLVSFYKERKQAKLASDKQSSEIKLAANEQAFRVWKELLDSLRKDFEKQSEDMQKLETEYASCREENAALKADLKIQAKEIEALKQARIEDAQEILAFKSVIEVLKTQISQKANAPQ